MDLAVGVRPRLGMDGDRVRARLGEGFEIRIDRRDHQMDVEGLAGVGAQRLHHRRSEEHTSELQSLMRISYAVFCLKKKKKLIIRVTQRMLTKICQMKCFCTVITQLTIQSTRITTQKGT